MLKLLLKSKNKCVEKQLEQPQNRTNFIGVKNAIMRILLSKDLDLIEFILNKQGINKKDLFKINSLKNGKYDVTLGFNSYGEDVCSKELETYLDAYKFSAVRKLLGYDLISY